MSGLDIIERSVAEVLPSQGVTAQVLKFGGKGR
jgi:hypothetical protein